MDNKTVQTFLIVAAVAGIIIYLVNRKKQATGNAAPAAGNTEPSGNNGLLGGGAGSYSAVNGGLAVSSGNGLNTNTNQDGNTIKEVLAGYGTFQRMGDYAKPISSYGGLNTGSNYGGYTTPAGTISETGDPTQTNTGGGYGIGG